MGGAFGHPQPALAPEDAGDFLDQMLLGRPARRMLGGQRRQELPDTPRRLSHGRTV